MTSWPGNAFLITVLCTGNPPVMRSFYISFILAWTRCWTNSRITDDLRRHGAQVASHGWTSNANAWCHQTTSHYLKQYWSRWPKWGGEDCQSGGREAVLDLICHHPFRHCKIIAILGAFQECWQHDDVINWKHFPQLLAVCDGNPSVTGGFSSQRPVTRSFDVFFDLCLNKRLSKNRDAGEFETPLR